MHMPHVTFNFMIHPRHPLSGLSGRPTRFVHMIPAFTSSNTLTGRTGRLHIFQTLVPSYRAQVFSCYAECFKSLRGLSNHVSHNPKYDFWLAQERRVACCATLALELNAGLGHHLLLDNKWHCLVLLTE